MLKDKDDWFVKTACGLSGDDFLSPNVSRNWLEVNCQECQGSERHWYKRRAQGEK